MKRIWLYLPLVCLLVMGNVLMAQAPDQEQKEEKPAYPTTGPRFVVCSPTGTMVKTPLYVKIDKDYLPLNISSRFPSERVTPEWMEPLTSTKKNLLKKEEAMRARKNSLLLTW